MRPQARSQRHHFTALSRIRFWYACLLVIAGVFVIRLFYLQVIRHDYYQTAALTKQLKEYEIPADRGVIEAYSIFGDDVDSMVCYLIETSNSSRRKGKATE